MLGLIIVDVEMQLMREGCVLFDKSRRTRVVYMKKSRASACDMTLNLREHACEQPCGPGSLDFVFVLLYGCVPFFVPRVCLFGRVVCQVRKKELAKK